MDETNSPEGDGEDKGADGQYEATYDLGQLQLHDVVRRCRLFLLLFVPTLDIQHFCFGNNFWCSFILEHLMDGKKNHLKEGNRHGEQHPDVDHLDVGSDRKALGKAQEAKSKNAIFLNYV